MISSASSIDLDGPVEAIAKFDPPTATVGSRVTYRIEVSALDESLTVPEQLPAPPGLVLSAGGRGQLYQPIGPQKLRPKTTVIFHVAVTNTGEFTIPSFELTAYGKPVKVPPTTLTVVPGDATNSTDAMELTLQLPPGDFYVGQAVPVQLILPAPKDGDVLGVTQPHVTGDFIFSEPNNQPTRQGNMTVDGKTFLAFVERVFVTPLRAGSLKIVGQANGYIIQHTASGSMQLNGLTLVDSEPGTLEVKALPSAGVLPGFTGAVGMFTIVSPKLSASEVRAGEPVTLTFRVVGTGNLGRLLSPPAPTLMDWQVFAPQPDTTPPAMIAQRGFANFTYTLIPLNDGLTSTPPIPFSYFNPETGAYADLTVPSVPIKVNPAATKIVSAASSAPTPGPDPEFADSNEKEPVLSGLAKTPGTETSLRPLQQQSWFWLAQIIPVGLLAALWAREKRRRYLALHPEVILKKRARRSLRRELRLARRAAVARDGAGFATRAANALREACAPHSAANPGALVCADVLRQFPEPDSQGGRNETVRRIFAAADAVRFSGPVKNESELLALQPALEEILTELRERL